MAENASSSSSDEHAAKSTTHSHGSTSIPDYESEEEKARQGEGMILDSYTKIWESFPENGGSNETNLRISRSPDLQHSASPN